MFHACEFNRERKIRILRDNSEKSYIIATLIDYFRSMIWEGNLRKLSTMSTPGARSKVCYTMSGADVLCPMEPLSVEALIGSDVTVSFRKIIHCASTGKTIPKAFGDGLSYSAWIAAPSAVESVLRPELSRIHEGIALRDFDWEQAHHNQPHCVYVSQTSGFKVGVTRSTNRPYRWHDQGAVGAIVVANVPYRQLAGEMEVALKSMLADKTNYRKMLQEVTADTKALEECREDCFEALGTVYESFFDDESAAHIFDYPVTHYPVKVQSVRLDKVPVIEGKLVGIKGQYFIFEDGSVFNVRRHAGYRVKMEW